MTGTGSLTTFGKYTTAESALNSYCANPNIHWNGRYDPTKDKIQRKIRSHVGYEVPYILDTAAVVLVLVS